MALSAFDIVRILRMPDYILADADSVELIDRYKGFENCYGLVKYAHRPDSDGWRRWYGPNGHILVEITKVTEAFAAACEFVVPSACVEKLPFNLIIMNLFVNFDWQIQWDEIGSATQDWENAKPSEEVSFPIKAGTDCYNKLKKIIATPYETLVTAHNAAELSLLRSKSP